LDDLIQEHLSMLAAQVAATSREVQRLNPLRLIDQRRQQLDDVEERLRMQMQHIISLKTERMRGLSLQLQSLSPLLTIARGYAVVRRDADQEILSSVKQVSSGDVVTIQVGDGHIVAIVR
jgi:exodeoxyribonuclease VII large subunit